MKLKSRLVVIGQGTMGGLIASLCCALPTAVLAAGLSGGVAATLISMGKFRLYTLIAGFAFVGIASWFSLWRSRSCCTQAEYRQRQIAVPLTVLASFAVAYVLIVYLVVPVFYKISWLMAP